MKTKIFFRLAIIFTFAFFIQEICKSQNFYDPSYMLMQQVIQRQQDNTNEFIEKQKKITRSIEYVSYDGKTINCLINMTRNHGFSNVKIRVTDSEKSRRYELSDSGGSFVIVHVGGSDWNLNYGDIITVTCDQAPAWIYTVGVDDHFSEPDWNGYKKNILLTAQATLKSRSNLNTSSAVTTNPVITNQIRNTNASNNNSSSKRINIDLLNTQISQLDRKINDAQNSLNLYRSWNDKNPTISNSNLVQSALNLIQTYQQQKYNLEQERNNLMY